MTTANNVFPNGPSQPPSAASLYAMLVELDQFRALPGFAVDYKVKTLVLLNAESPSEGETGYVYGDADPAKNGTYLYSVGPGWIFQGVTEQQLREAADAALSAAIEAGDDALADQIAAATDSLLGGVDADGNTLAKLKALIDLRVTEIDERVEEITAFSDETEFWIDRPASTPATAGALTATGTPYSSTRFVGPAVGATSDGIARSVTVEVTSALTAKIILVQPIRQNGTTFRSKVIAVKDVSGIGTGTQTIDLGDVPIEAGARVFIRRSAGAIDGDGTTAGSAEINASTAAVDDMLEMALGINRGLSIRLNYDAFPRSLGSRGIKGGLVADAGGDQRVDTSDAAGSVAATTGLPPQRIEVGADVGVDIPSGSSITGVRANLAIATSKADRFVLAIYRRETSDGNVDASMNTGTPEFLFSRLYLASAFGLVADGAHKDCYFDTDAIEVEDGYTYYAVISGITAAGGLGQFGYGTAHVRGQDRQRRRGWTIAGTGVTNVLTGTVNGALLVPISLGMGFIYVEPVGQTVAREQRDPVVRDKIMDATLTADGFDLDTRVLLNREYVEQLFTDSRTITAAAAGKERFDVLYLQRSALTTFAFSPTFGVAAGTERDEGGDAPEFIPTVDASLQGNQTPIARLKVTDSEMTVLPCWDVVNGDLEHLLPEIRADRERNQRILRRALGRIYRGGAVQIAGIGDSIMALGNVGVSPGSAAANGAARDIGTTQYYNAALGSDIISGITLYTAVQLGRADDSAGAVHTKLGFMWTFVEACQELGGQALGASGIVYDNWGINSQKWSNLSSGGTASTWLQNFCTAGGDLVVINIGMNDYTNPVIRTDALNTISYIRANMEDRDGNAPPIIIMGVAKPNSGIAQNFWRDCNRRLRDICTEAEVAFIDLLPWYDTPNLRAVGLTVDDTCTANGNNHPGIYEQQHIMGRALVNGTLG